MTEQEQSWLDADAEFQAWLDARFPAPLTPEELAADAGEVA